MNSTVIIISIKKTNDVGTIYTINKVTIRENENVTGVSFDKSAIQFCRKFSPWTVNSEQ